MKKNSKVHDREKELFEAWLAEMDDQVEWFIENMGKNRQKFNFSPESLLDLELFLLNRYKSNEEIRRNSEYDVTDGAARYLGETFNKNTGSKWFISFEDEKNVYFRRPQLGGGRYQKGQICPVVLIYTSVDRRKGGFLYNYILREIKEK